MTDREKVIKALECYCESNSFDRPNCKDCPAGCMLGYMSIPFIQQVLALLKEQEAVVRCKDCKHRPKEPNYKTYESGFDIEFPEGSKCPCRCSGDGFYSWYPEDDWFCADGERQEGR
jgi:hypothetical protein